MANRDEFESSSPDLMANPLKRRRDGEIDGRSLRRRSLHPELFDRETSQYDEDEDYLEEREGALVGVGRFAALHPNVQQSIKKYQDFYHQRHGSGKNIAYDTRLTPETRMRRMLKWAARTGQMSEQEAIEYTLRAFEEQGKNIAGNWGEVNLGDEI